MTSHSRANTFKYHEEKNFVYEDRTSDHVELKFSVQVAEKFWRGNSNLIQLETSAQITIFAVVKKNYDYTPEPKFGYQT